MAIVEDETQGRMMELFRQFSAVTREGSPVCSLGPGSAGVDNIIASDGGNQ